MRKVVLFLVSLLALLVFNDETPLKRFLVIGKLKIVVVVVFRLEVVKVTATVLISPIGGLNFISLIQLTIYDASLI